MEFCKEIYQWRVWLLYERKLGAVIGEIFSPRLKKIKNKKRKEGPLEMVSYKATWNVKNERFIVCLKKKIKKRCMECENERFIVYVDGMKAVFKKK